MALTYDVDDTFGLSAEAASHVHESRRSRSTGRFEVLDEAGEIADHRAAKFSEDDVTIRGQGDANFAAVTVGPFTAGEVKTIEAEGSETNDGEYREFEIVGKAYSNFT